MNENSIIEILLYYTFNSSSETQNSIIWNAFFQFIKFRMVIEQFCLNYLSSLKAVF